MKNLVKDKVLLLIERFLDSDEYSFDLIDYLVSYYLDT